MIVIAVALHRLAARLANGMTQRLRGLLFRSRRARHVEDLFSHDRAVQIVHAVAQSDLGKGKAHADPISGEMVEVIEINAADREIAQLIESGGPRKMREDRALPGSKANGMKPVKPPVSSCNSRNCRR